MPDRERAVYVISVVADLAGVHPQTLRMYERKGLLEPERTAGNSRRYSERDVDQLRHIQDLTQHEGINLSGVRRIIALENKLLAAETELARLRRRVVAVEARLKERDRFRGVLVRLSDVANPWT
ncbi:MAG: helix-turn-helix transcriptional regulator [Actinomycetota bacterium]